MEKRKHRRSITDDLSTVKAAAWAWYQHGSGSEGKPTREFDVTRTHLHPPKPSRFKTEAMNFIKEYYIQDFSSQTVPSPLRTDRDHSLLDAYEVERISKQLDDLIISTSNRFNGGYFDDKNLDRQKSTGSTVSLSSDGYCNTAILKKNKKKKEKKYKNFFKGLWLRHAVVCGTREDVDSSALVRNRPLPTVARQHVPVITMAVCGPRIAHA